MAAFSPISSALFISSIEILLFSKFPKETELFYKILSNSLEPSSAKETLRFQLIPSIESSTGFKIGSERGYFPQDIDPDKRHIQWVSATDQSSASFSFSNRWITVLRAHDLQKTIQFYDFCGKWQEEQHDAGPIHYSNTINDFLFEIYPLRKGYPQQNIEFIVAVDCPTKIANELKQNHFQALETRPLFSLFKDPDGRLVQMRRTRIIGTLWCDV